MINLSKYIDHTILKSDATMHDVKKLCDEAMQYNFASVCINACWVSYAKQLLSGTDIKIATVVGFPLGATTTSIKIAESIEAVKNGANEIDMVINIGWAKNGNFEEVGEEIKAVVEGSGAVVKVILETCKLSKSEIISVVEVAVKNGAHFVKTSTGFGEGGATIEDVMLIKANCGNCEVKASGGIRNYESAMAFVNAGATRLGTSAGIEIVKGINR